MAVIGFNDRNITKDVWHIITDGAQDAAITLISIMNRSTDSCMFAMVFGEGTLTQGQSAVSGGDFLTADTHSFLWEDELIPSQGVYFDSSQGGKILIPSGKKLAIAISGLGDLEINISGMEI